MNKNRKYNVQQNEETAPRVMLMASQFWCNGVTV